MTLPLLLSHDAYCYARAQVESHLLPKVRKKLAGGDQGGTCVFGHVVLDP